MEFQGSCFLIRPYRAGDEATLPKHADNRNVWRNLRDRFPRPYGPEEAKAWLKIVREQGEPVRNFAIELGGEVVGGIGMELMDDVFRGTAELGYWLGEAYWGKGIATEAVGLFVPYVLRTFDPFRLEAGVFGWNPASARVLEKNGFKLEARLDRAVVKGGERTDYLIYVRPREGQ